MWSFKVGDVVECLRDCGDVFTKGNEYTVLDINDRRIEFIDDQGNKNGWVKEYFKRSTPFIYTQPTLKPGSYGYLHITQRNEAVKVSVKGMTSAPQIRETIKQLEKIALFLEEK